MHNIIKIIFYNKHNQPKFITNVEIKQLRTYKTQDILTADQVSFVPIDFKGIFITI